MNAETLKWLTAVRYDYFDVALPNLRLYRDVVASWICGRQRNDDGIKPYDIEERKRLFDIRNIPNVEFHHLQHLAYRVSSELVFFDNQHRHGH
jgi:hypothetical protein